MQAFAFVDAFADKTGEFIVAWAMSIALGGVPMLLQAALGTCIILLYSSPKRDRMPAKNTRPD